MYSLQRKSEKEKSKNSSGGKNEYCFKVLFSIELFAGTNCMFYHIGSGKVEIPGCTGLVRILKVSCCKEKQGLDRIVSLMPRSRIHFVKKTPPGL